MKKGRSVCDSCLNGIGEKHKFFSLYRSIYKEHFDCFQSALQKVSADEINKGMAGYETLLYNAFASTDDERFFASLLEKRADPNTLEEGKSILYHVVNTEEDTPRFIQLLLEAKAALNTVEWNDVDETHLPLMVSAGLKPDGYKYIERYYIPHVMCREVTWALVCILRKRFRIPSVEFPNGGYLLPLGLVQQIAQSVWNTRRNTEVWWSIAGKKKKT